MKKRITSNTVRIPVAILLFMSFLLLAPALSSLVERRRHRKAAKRLGRTKIFSFGITFA